MSGVFGCMIGNRIPVNEDLRDKGDLDGSHVYINEEYINRKHLFTPDQIKGTIAKWRNSTKKFTRQELKEGDFYITIPDFKLQEIDALRRRREHLQEMQEFYSSVVVD